MGWGQPTFYPRVRCWSPSEGGVSQGLIRAAVVGQGLPQRRGSAKPPRKVVGGSCVIQERLSIPEKTYQRGEAGFALGPLPLPEHG